MRGHCYSMLRSAFAEPRSEGHCHASPWLRHTIRDLALLRLCLGGAVLYCGLCIVPRLTVMICHRLSLFRFAFAPLRTSMVCRPTPSPLDSMIRSALASQCCDVLCSDLPLPSPAPESSLRPRSALPCHSQLNHAFALRRGSLGCPESTCLCTDSLLLALPRLCVAKRCCAAASHL